MGVEKYKVLCYGAINPDFVYQLESVPQAGEDLQANSWYITYGGKAATSAVALAGWGVEVQLMGLVAGKDALGEILDEKLSEQGVDTSYMCFSTAEKTRHCQILITPDGERTIVSTGYDGAEWQNVPERLWEGVMGVVVDGFGGDAAAEVVRQANERQLPVVWTDAPETAKIDWGIVVWSDKEHDLEEAMQLSESGTDVALTCGSNPIYMMAEGRRWTQTPPKTELVDSTGAGDVFAAAFMHGILEYLGDPVIDSFEIAESAAVAASMWAARGRLDPMPDLMKWMENTIGMLYDPGLEIGPYDPGDVAAASSDDIANSDEEPEPSPKGIVAPF